MLVLFLDKWSSAKRSSTRIAVVSIIGMPSCIQSIETCSLICSSWGLVVDKWESCEGNSTCWRWLVLTEKKDWIHDKLTIQIEGVQTDVCIVEDLSLSLNLLLNMAKAPDDCSKTAGDNLETSDEEGSEFSFGDSTGTVNGGFFRRDSGAALPVVGFSR